MTGAEIVYIDERVTRTMSQDPDEGLVGYIRQDIHEKAVRSAGTRERETIVQLPSWGRVWAFGSEKKEDLPAWVAITDFLPQAELSS